MSSFRTIAVTAVIAVAGTVAAFSGLHLGQAPAQAAQAATGMQQVKAQPSYTVTVTAKDLARLASLVNARQVDATARTTQRHGAQVHHQRQVTRAIRHAVRSGGASAGAPRPSASRTAYRCDGSSHEGFGRSGSHHDGSGCR